MAISRWPPLIRLNSRRHRTGVEIVPSPAEHLRLCHHHCSWRWRVLGRPGPHGGGGFSAGGREQDTLVPTNPLGDVGLHRSPRQAVDVPRSRNTSSSGTIRASTRTPSWGTSTWTLGALICGALNCSSSAIAPIPRGPTRIWAVRMRRSPALTLVGAGASVEHVEFWSLHREVVVSAWTEITLDNLF